MEPLWRHTPRLDSPDRLWLLPAPQAKWLGAGLFSGPLLAQVLAFFGGYGSQEVWSLPVVWAVWALGLVVGALGAFYRPGGLHLGEWFAVAVNYVLVPRRATWMPPGGRKREGS